jgi:hypothetical protein
LLLFWSAITGVFDVIAVGSMVWQALAWRYAQTQGTITEFRVEQHHDSDGDTTWHPVVKYHYQVAGKQYEGNRIRFFEMTFNSGRQQVKEAQRRFVVGRPVPVYYDPGRPERAILDRRLRGQDFFLLLFLNPFNIIMVVGWYFLVASRRRGAKPASVKIRDDGLRIVARLYNLTPLAGAALAVLVSSFVLIFVCGFSSRGMPADWLVAVSWLIVLGSAAAAWWYFGRPATTIKYDRFSSRVSIAAADGQSHAFNAADVVRLVKATAASRGDEQAAITLSIGYRDARGEEHTVRLVRWWSGDAVDWLRNWLRDTLRLPSEPEEAAIGLKSAQNSAR